MSAGAGPAELELTVPADPALALTTRMFAGAVAEHLDGAAPEDLKLAFSELLAAGVDAGSAQVAYRVDLTRGVVSVRGAGALDQDHDDDLEDHERFARRHRSDLLGALFPGLRAESGLVELPIAPAE